MECALSSESPRNTCGRLQSGHCGLGSLNSLNRLETIKPMIAWAKKRLRFPTMIAPSEAQIKSLEEILKAKVVPRQETCANYYLLYVFVDKAHNIITVKPDTQYNS